ncbi:MAG: hypothetical protein ACYC6L_12685 [Anaerolineae bacterium]
MTKRITILLLVLLLVAGCATVRPYMNRKFFPTIMPITTDVPFPTPIPTVEGPTIEPPLPTPTVPKDVILEPVPNTKALPSVKISIPVIDRPVLQPNRINVPSVPVYQPSPRFPTIYSLPSAPTWQKLPSLPSVSGLPNMPTYRPMPNMPTYHIAW